MSYLEREIKCANCRFTERQTVKRIPLDETALRQEAMWDRIYRYDHDGSKCKTYVPYKTGWVSK